MYFIFRYEDIVVLNVIKIEYKKKKKIIVN